MGIRLRGQIQAIRLLRPPTPTVMRDAGRDLAVKIINRTFSGVDEDGKRFAPYSPDYAAQKNVSPTNVTLLRSGEMLNGLDVVSYTDRHVTIGWRDPTLRDRASYQENPSGGRHQSTVTGQFMKGRPARRFLGIPKGWVTDFKRYLIKHLTS